MSIRSLLVTFFVFAPIVATAAELEIGAAIPDFAFQGERGALYRRADFLGNQAFVVAWFPKAFTSG